MSSGRGQPRDGAESAAIECDLECETSPVLDDSDVHQQHLLPDKRQSPSMGSE